MDLRLCHQLESKQCRHLRGRDVLAHRAAITDPAGQPRMVVGLQRCRLLSVFRLLLDIGLPAPRLKPVVRKADLGAGETSAVGGVGLDGLQASPSGAIPSFTASSIWARQAALPRSRSGGYAPKSSQPPPPRARAKEVLLQVQW